MIKDKTLLHLPFDQYSRQYLTYSLIKKTIGRNKKLSIIDLGGHGGKTRDFHKEDTVTILDVFDEKYDNYIKGDATNTTFIDNEFDVSCSFDVLEHIPRQKRQKFIEEALRISKFGAFIAMPIDYEKKVANAEDRLNKFYKYIFKEDHRWLKEHIDYRIPTEKEVEKILKKIGVNYVTIKSNEVGDWQLLQSLIFSSSKDIQTSKDIDEITKWYNKNISTIEGDIKIPYRKIFFVSNSDKNIKAIKSVIKASKQAKKIQTITVSEDVFDNFLNYFAKTVRKNYELNNDKTPALLKEMNKKNEDLKKEIRDFQKRDVALSKELDKIRNSLSWRLTKPLRVIGRVVK